MTHLLHVFPSFAVGGAQTVTASVSNALGSAFTHTIVSLDGRREGLDLLNPGIRARLIDGRELRRGGLAVIRRFLAGAACDLLLTCNWGSFDWTIAKPPRRQIHQEHGFGPEEAAGQLRRRVWLRRLALRRVWRVVVPSHTLAGIARRTWWVPAGRLVHIPNGVPDAPDEPGPREGTIRIGTVAPLRPEKRLDWLLRAFAALPPAPACRLVIAGDGPERGRLETLARELGIGERVAFLGHRPEPRRILRELDLYALSSATEQLPMSLLDAMALGLPVAGVAVGDVARAVAEPNRPFIAKVNDFDALAQALRTLTKSAQLRAALGKANRERQRAAYSERCMVESYAMLIEAGLR